MALCPSYVVWVCGAIGGLESSQSPEGWREDKQDNKGVKERSKEFWGHDGRLHRVFRSQRKEVEELESLSPQM